jgi:hypothetical protein
MNLSFKTIKSIGYTYDILTDMQKFVLVHPVITKIDVIGEDRYLVHETLKFGFIPFSFTYPAIIEKNMLDKKVTIRATVFRLNKIEMKFALKEENGFTIIDEEIRFSTPLPIKSIMKRIFREQHEKLFQNIDAN